MPAVVDLILVLNGGSSSIKFAVYGPGDAPTRQLHGHLDRIGQPGTRLTFSEAADTSPTTCPATAADPVAAASFLVDWLARHAVFARVAAVGHRVVYGGPTHQAPELITPALLTDLQQLTAYDPDHLPGELALMLALHERYPQLRQVACFDTAFHQHMPRVAQQLPLPRRFEARGLRRYGFHGLSYAYLLEELARQAGPAASRGKVILAHLGSGASLAAVLDGQSQDTSMGFTPAAGLVMGTRPGDLDPGVAAYLLQVEQLTAKEFNHLINHESGLLGVSETSADMQDLLAAQATDARAAEAVALFCYQARKWVGAYAAVLGGLDTLVFSGGIGAHAAEVRARICAGLAFLGLELDAAYNATHASVISSAASRVVVRVIPTDEERLIAQLVAGYLTP
ncbi:acetate/propionate family kinase [Hymenobacter sp. PAMC 26628]|uniref:acetate/propionate family kinase n=1 Tax=Hymenobacter sp. PAMC 26628 TaxID=1484118 RepID=UPI00076FDF77|nr:acetate/propionate family kinase [Hymenobacter sp. PAMC 26628]AMJ66005.1 acetate kinase [Hymenobacter sp. PAMC 26628]